MPESVLKPCVIDEKTLEAYLRLERMQGIGLVSLRAREKDYAVFMRVASFLAFEEASAPMSRNECLGCLRAFLAQTAPWLATDAETLLEAMQEVGFLKVDGEDLWLVHAPQGSLKKSQALQCLAKARCRIEMERVAVREALTRRNRTVNAKPMPEVDAIADERFMQEALFEARKAQARGEVPVGAVLVRNGEILARAGNRVVADHDPSAHAELLAIREASANTGFERLSGTTLYVTLEPCPMCTAAALLARVSRIVWGADDVKAGACGGAFNLQEQCSMNHRIAYTGGLLREPCLALLTDFFRSCRKEV